MSESQDELWQELEPQLSLGREWGEAQCLRRDAVRQQRDNYYLQFVWEMLRAPWSRRHAQREVGNGTRFLSRSWLRRFAFQPRLKLDLWVSRESRLPPCLVLSSQEESRARWSPGEEGTVGSICCRMLWALPGNHLRAMPVRKGPSRRPALLWTSSVDFDVFTLPLGFPAVLLEDSTHSWLD